ncbi:MAG: hypothetical protein K0S07_75 [Chlamydiales bacterium]|jgi:hypothetical protein|nr:hypothetical protein [Chlamydiales bacterium]
MSEINQPPSSGYNPPNNDGYLAAKANNPNSVDGNVDTTGAIAPSGKLRKETDPTTAYNPSAGSTVNTQSFTSSGETLLAESPVLDMPTATPAAVMQMDPKTLAALTSLPDLIAMISESFTPKTKSDDASDPALPSSDAEEEAGPFFSKMFQVLGQKGANGDKQDLANLLSESGEGEAATGSAKSSSPLDAGLEALLGLPILEGIGETFAADSATFEKELNTVLTKALGTDLAAAIDKAASSKDPNALTAEELKVANSYLTLLAHALALISSMKQKMSQADSNKVEDATRAKQDAVQLKIKETEENQKTVLDQIKAKQEGDGGCALVLKIIMPIATAVVAIIAVVAAIFTGGQSLWLIGLMIAASIAMTVVTTLDSALDLTAKLAAEIGGPLASLVMAFAMILIVLVTAGGGLAIAAAALARTASSAVVSQTVASAVRASVGTSVQESIKQAGKSTIQTTLTQVAKDVFMTKMGVALVTTLVVEVLMSSGLLNQAITESVLAMGGSQEDAMIVSIVLTVIIAIFMMCFAVYAAGSATKGITSAADDIAEEGAGAAATGTASAASTVVKAAKEGDNLAGSVTQVAAQKAIELAAEEAKKTEKLLSKFFLKMLEKLEELIGLAPGSFKNASSLSDVGSIAGNIAGKSVVQAGEFGADVIKATVGWAGKDKLIKIVNTLTQLSQYAEGAVITASGTKKLEMAEENLELVKALAEIRTFLAYYDMDVKAFDSIYQLCLDMLKEGSQTTNGMFEVFKNIIKGQQAILQKMTDGGM